jgi:UDP-galactopyranose mutase
MNLSGLKYLVVGSGFFGSVIAERIAEVLKERVLVIERRPHVGGNSFSETDPETGIEVHKYGSHIFHTSDERVVSYLQKFSAFNTYQHRVLTTYRGQVYTMPINLLTINQYYKKKLNPSEAKAFIEEEIRKENILNPTNLEEKAISLIGRGLYEAFIQGYTQKQWNHDPRKLPASIITRLPVRFNYNDRYFNDSFEGQPVDGYGKLFERLLSHPNIDIATNCDFFEIRRRIPANCLIIYTGPIDRFFDFKFGPLSWRTLDFEGERVDVDDYQGTSVMNFADAEVPYTRVHEYKHLHPERKHAAGKSIIYKEFSRAAKANDTPYYPVNTAEDRARYGLYREEAEKLPNVIFGGRLGKYAYVDMHQAIAMALNTFNSAIKSRKDNFGRPVPEAQAEL